MFIVELLNKVVKTNCKLWKVLLTVNGIVYVTVICIGGVKYGHSDCVFHLMVS